MRAIGGMVVLMAALLAAPAQAERLVVVMGLDETGSYQLRGKALGQLGEVIAKLAPGDVAYVRRITDRSYEDQAAVLRLALPELTPKPANEYDRKALAAWRAQANHQVQLKRQALGLLAGLEPVKARRTDIYGFLAAAGDRFEHEGRDSRDRRLVIILSDLEDNVGLKAVVNLRGAEVWTAGFQSGADAEHARRLKERWTRYLTKEAGAGPVKFFPADVRLPFQR